MTFTTRPLSSSGTLGERLKIIRQEARLEVDDVARQINVAGKYIAAIETGHYTELPGLVYAKQFVRRYAELLQTDADAAVSLLEQEYNLVTKSKGQKRPLLIPRAKTEFPWWRRYSRVILAGVITAGVLAYLGYQAVNIFMPPPLTISQPNGDVATTELTILIGGQTDPNAHVTINDQDVEITTNGAFSESVDLHPGLNTLKISAIKKHSGARVVTRQILVETKK